MSVRDYNAKEENFVQNLNKEFKVLQVELLKVEVQLKKAELERLRKM